MKRFFRIISRVSELNTMLLQHFEQAIIKKPELSNISIINQEFELVDTLINTRNDRIFMRPVKMIEIGTVCTLRNRKMNSGAQIDM